MGFFSSILGGIAEEISNSIKKNTGIDLAKEFKDTKKSYNEYKGSKKTYDDFVKNKEEYIERYGEEDYLEKKREMENEIHGNMNEIKNNFQSNANDVSNKVEQTKQKYN